MLPPVEAPVRSRWPRFHRGKQSAVVVYVQFLLKRERSETMQPDLPTLQEGELYVVQHGQLKHLERPPDDLPRVPISQAARERLLELRRRCRKALGGFRPDVALVASALIEQGAGSNDAELIVAAYYAATAAAQASSLGQNATGGKQE